MALRLWLSDVQITQPGGAPIPLWYGAIYRETRRRGVLPLFKQRALGTQETVPLLLTGHAAASSGAPVLRTCATAGQPSVGAAGPAAAR